MEKAEISIKLKETKRPQQFTDKRPCVDFKFLPRENVLSILVFLLQIQPQLLKPFLEIVFV
jgi:hypothetical protein